MKFLSQVTLIGRLTKTAVIKQMSNGKKVANFCIATSEKWKSKDGEAKEQTQFHNVVVFSEGLISVIERFTSKGSRLYIEGALQTRKWQDKNGNDCYTTEIVLQGYNASLLLLDSKEKTQSQSQTQATGSYGKSQSGYSEVYTQQDEENGEIPF